MDQNSSLVFELLFRAYSPCRNTLLCLDKAGRALVLPQNDVPQTFLVPNEMTYPLEGVDEALGWGKDGGGQGDWKEKELELVCKLQEDCCFFKKR